MTILSSSELVQDVSDTLADKDFSIYNLENEVEYKDARISDLELQVAELTPPPIQRITPKLGVFTGGGLSNNPEPIALRIQHWDEWLYGIGGQKTELFVDFIAENSWSSAAGSLALVHKWKTIPGQLVLGMPLVTAEKNGAAGFAEVIAGQRDANFIQMFNALVNNQLADTIIRLAIEPTGNWKPWNAATDSIGFIRAFRHVVALSRTIPGQQFKWVWNPSIGLNSIPWTDCYPGSFFVDLIGFDIYDMWLGQIPQHTQEQRWETALNGRFGLKDIASFAKMSNKPLVIPEWGVGRDINNSQGGGIENPFFIDKMWEFMSDPINGVAWHCYWNRDAGSGYESQIFPTNLRPLTAAKYKEKFGAI